LIAAVFLSAALSAWRVQSGPLPSPEAAQTELEAGHYAVAEKDYQAIVAAHPRMAAAWVDLGISCFLQKKYQAAREALEQGLKLDPGMANGWLMLGISDFNLYRPEDAVGPLNQFIAKRPDDLQGHYYLGLSLLSLGRYPQAEQSLIAARRIAPRNVDVLYHLAECYLHEAQETRRDQIELRKKFERTVQEIAAIDPHSFRIGQLQAGYYEASGQNRKAIHELKILLKHDPKVSGLHYTLGCLYMEQRRYAPALSELQKELLLDLPYPRTFLQMGHIYVEEHQPERALPYLEKAVQIDSEKAISWVELGRAYEEMGQLEKAAGALQKGIQLGDQKASTYFVLGRVYRKLGRQDLARAAIEKSEQLSHQESARQIERVQEETSASKTH
jgi:tetratricopeptide (TPR) repeat protein